MWRWILVLVAALLASSGCGRDVSITNGSEEVVTDTRQLEQYERLLVRSPFEVEVSAGEQDQVILRVSENLQDRVRAEVEGDTLVIELEPGLNLGEATLEADVTASALTQVEAGGASTVSLADPILADEFRASLTGASHLDGEVEVGRLEVGASGASDIELRGSSGVAVVEARGASEAALANLTVDVMTIELSGASSSEVTVSGELGFSLSGASHLAYAGEPQLTRQQISGASSAEGS